MIDWRTCKFDCKSNMVDRWRNMELGLLRKRSNAAEGNTLKLKKNCQIFAYLIIIDFESTCWQDCKSRPQEIIEFPAVLLNTSTGEIESEFHYYVQPHENPVLSSFCTELTGITQEQVEGGIPLFICLKKFSQWLKKISQERDFVYNSTEDKLHKKCTFVTWSDWDFGVCLKYETQRKQLKRPIELNSWIDLRATYRKFYDRRPNGLNGALQDLGITFEGREHSGIVDSRNTAILAYRMMRDGCIMAITKSIAGVVPTAAIGQHFMGRTPGRISDKQISANVKKDTPLPKQTNIEMPDACISSAKVTQPEENNVQKLSNPVVTLKPVKQMQGFSCLEKKPGIIDENFKIQYTKQLQNLQPSSPGHGKIIDSSLRKNDTTKQFQNVQTNLSIQSNIPVPFGKGVKTVSELRSNNCNDKLLLQKKDNKQENISQIKHSDHLLTKDSGCNSQVRKESVTNNFPQNVTKLSSLNNAFNRKGEIEVTAKPLQTLVQANLQTKVSKSSQNIFKVPSPVVQTNVQFNVPDKFKTPSGLRTLSGYNTRTPSPVASSSLNKFKTPSPVTSIAENRFKTPSPVLITSGNKFRTPSPVMNNQTNKLQSPVLNNLLTKVNTPSPFQNVSACKFKTPSPVQGNLNISNHSSWSEFSYTSPSPRHGSSLNHGFMNDSILKRTPPMCECGRRTSRKIVQSPGPNVGRAFYCCPKGRKESLGKKKNGCGFFKWEPSCSISPNFSASRVNFNSSKASVLSSGSSMTFSPPTPSSEETGQNILSPPPQPNFNTPSTNRPDFQKVKHKTDDCVWESEIHNINMSDFDNSF